MKNTIKVSGIEILAIKWCSDIYLTDFIKNVNANTTTSSMYAGVALLKCIDEELLEVMEHENESASSDFVSKQYSLTLRREEASYLLEIVKSILVNFASINKNPQENDEKLIIMTGIDDLSAIKHKLSLMLK